MDCFIIILLFTDGKEVQIATSPAAGIREHRPVLCQ